eukprot:116307-Prymnesium_polylepis.1
MSLTPLQTCTCSTESRAGRRWSAPNCSRSSSRRVTCIRIWDSWQLLQGYGRLRAPSRYPRVLRMGCEL